ncbi:MAG: hypothetical protein A3C02_01200 [Candidatus Andersenbacteria bacterium RIFCSPHIGHO2_02_FULL_45_11]|uniref:Uncharacterized protein n=1 Tax=Candidatus Andersenbacteria bacterium RIFCSPHIGHO2_12_FULL_45_11 TaxID=1797281 RepID=A0A1G1X2G6_9BACT|nr:MAG: hypothetical protein A2805_03340 [Candidatus Andersenbacteria bacterium RIFCSPHIGHO2_01_FULL_46_36]OGY32375.1 MAG: hypothetical protein A3C02_01200 [Candidatus Andersenbacteria bacterium RIFCSPHIGHO2_02_FULL_45_11]OGY34206.1 MAG: hypothetical protein A3D99_03645 [Candidatus Andersenbacteria bacterium RIFCSPHIGHO2_12_FULL_45_11]
MKQASNITIIDNEVLRGILAPAGALSKKVLTDMLDFIELSSDESSKESDIRIREADKKKSWETIGEVRDAAASAD